MDTSGYAALLVPLLIGKLPFNLRQKVWKWHLGTTGNTQNLNRWLRGVLF